MVFAFKNATGNFGWSYRYITDPPLLADIGEFDLDVENVTFKVDFDSAFNDGIMDVLINDIEVDIEPWNVSFDGISDFSELETRTINYIGNILTKRLVSTIKYAGAERMNIIINKVLELIPDEKNIPNTNLYVEGGIS